MIKIVGVLLLFCILMVPSVDGQQVVTSAMAPDIRFTSGNSALKIPFDLYNNHIYLQVSVNGSKPLSFLFDTGAQHFIDSKQAKALGLKLKFQGQVAGIGEGTVDLYSSKKVSFSLPGVSLSDQEVGVIPLDGVSACVSEVVVDERGQMRKCEPNEQRCQTRVVDGILGHDFFKRFVVEIDYEARVINLYSPGNYKYQGTGESLPLEITKPHIFVQGRLSLAGRAPVNGRFLVDTGGAHSLILTRPFVEANGLLPPAPELTKFPACGIGGHSEILIGTLGALQLGNIKISEPVTGFARAESGAFAAASYDGNIGAGILRHFKLIFDYSRSRMIMESLRKE